jgi:hypothetical protein
MLLGRPFWRPREKTITIFDQKRYFFFPAVFLTFLVIQNLNLVPDPLEMLDPDPDPQNWSTPLSHVHCTRPSSSKKDATSKSKTSLGFLKHDLHSSNNS